MLGLLSLLASRRHTVPYANLEASTSCSLVRPARLRAALILFSSLGATWFPSEPSVYCNKEANTRSHTWGRLRSLGVDLKGGYP